MVFPGGLLLFWALCSQEWQFIKGKWLNYLRILNHDNTVIIVNDIAFGQPDQLSVEEIIVAMDNNLNAKSRIMKSKMIVKGRRSTRTIESKNWVVGANKAFTEYLSPPREAGTKMLKLDDKLWTYSPQTDRVIQISGHMLRHSVMGSDMSYNDMMEDRPIQDLYNATLEGS